MQKLESGPVQWAAARANAPAWFDRALAAPFDERRVEVDGCSIRYLRWGEPGRPGIVMVHGGAASPIPGRSGHGKCWPSPKPRALPARRS